MRRPTADMPRNSQRHRSSTAERGETTPHSPPGPRAGYAASLAALDQRLLGREDRSATFLGAAPAGVELLVLLGVLIGPLVRIIVEQFLTGLDVAASVDEDALAIVDGFGVAVAR